MHPHCHPRLRGLLCVAALLLAAPAPAQNTNAAQEVESAWKAAQASAQMGPGEVKLREQATLKLPARHAFIPDAAAARVLNAMGNPTGARLLGLIVPTGENSADWMVVARYEASGYIRDSDAKDWDVDELFKSLKEGTEQSNAEREKRGIPAIEVTGWIERPHYDAATHRLVWSIAARDKGASGDAAQIVNYNTYALGRQGYISLNLITSRKDVETDKHAAQTLLANLDFNGGKRYADFNSSTDKVAEYGLAALVAGVAAKKLGLLAVIAAFLAKFAKFAIIAAGGLLYGIGKLFKRKSGQ